MPAAAHVSKIFKDKSTLRRQHSLGRQDGIASLSLEKSTCQLQAPVCTMTKAGLYRFYVAELVIAVSAMQRESLASSSKSRNDSLYEITSCILKCNLTFTPMGLPAYQCPSRAGHHPVRSSRYFRFSSICINIRRPITGNHRESHVSMADPAQPVSSKTEILRAANSKFERRRMTGCRPPTPALNDRKYILASRKLLPGKLFVHLAPVARRTRSTCLQCT